MNLLDDLGRYKDFEFIYPDIMIDAELELELEEARPSKPEKGFVPEYRFSMVNTKTGAVMGNISLRVGLTEKLKELGGHIGYEVEEQYRGNNYAARSCRLLYPLFRKLEINPAVITCALDNLPSVRTIESLGGTLIATKSVEIEPSIFRSTNIYYLFV